MQFIEEGLYKKILQNIPIPCVDVAIVTKGSVLLVKRTDSPAKGEWWVPGGRILKGEMMKAAAHRKAKEEVGLDCFVGPIVHTSETIFDDGPHGIPVHSINSCFLLTPILSEIAPVMDARQSDYRWIDFICESLHPYVRSCLKGSGLPSRP